MITDKPAALKDDWRDVTTSQKMALNWSAIILCGITLCLVYNQGVTADKQDRETFRCHTCSYAANVVSNVIACLNNTASLPLYTNSIKCGNFCTIQETWDKHKREINSVFRTCSTNWGNNCYEDATFITCRESCKGDFCNNNSVTNEDRIETLCRKFSCDSGSRTIHHAVSTTIAITTCILAFWKLN